ncbi:MAG: hypothetical protein Q9199_003184 [Rusavskia elegans]
MQEPDPASNANPTPKPPVLETEHAPNQRSPDGGGPSLVVEQPDSTREQEKTSTLIAGQSGQLQPPSANPDQPQTGMRSFSNASEPSNTSPQPELETNFRMVIHLLNERIAQRLACLDTCSDFDVISHQVVDSLHLDTDTYTGEAIRPVGPITNSFKPEKQVTLDWHVAKFPKTYTTTFVVFNEEHSDEFDILLGTATIKKIGFYKKNSKVWWSSAGREVCLSE